MGAGRRQRMREKVHLNGIAGLAQHEILEFLLYPYVPQKDTVPIAHALLEEFGTLDNVLHATEEALLTVAGMPKLAALTFPQLRHIIARAATDAAVDRGKITDAGKDGRGIPYEQGQDHLCPRAQLRHARGNGRGDT